MKKRSLFKGIVNSGSQGILIYVQKHELSCGITSGPLCPTVFKKNISTAKRRAHRGHRRTGYCSLQGTFSNDTLTLPLCALFLCLFLFLCLLLIPSLFLCLFQFLGLQAMTFGIHEEAYTYVLNFPDVICRKMRAPKNSAQNLSLIVLSLFTSNRLKNPFFLFFELL